MNKSRFIATVLVLALFTLLPNAYLSAQTPGNTEILDSIDVSDLDYYLDTADRQQFEQRWLDYARFGLSAVTASWEKEVFLVMGDEFDIEMLRIEAEEKLQDIVDERFALWLNKKFFESVSVPSLGELNAEIENLNNQYLFETEPDGSKKYKTTENYEDEKQLWAQGVKTKIGEQIDIWSQRMTTAFAELRSTFTDSGLRNKIDKAYTGSFESYKNAYNKRLYRLYQIEQSRFSRLRLYYQYSLQHQSESETAAYITNNLIAQTQAGLDSKLDTLTAGLESAVGDVHTDGGIIDADNWRNSFSSLLEEGMKSWDDAEQQLLMERIQWEQRAGFEASEGEEAWADSFMQLREKRTQWMTDFRETLEEGNNLWAEESLALENAITKAIDEINENINNSDASLQGRIDNLVGMMLQSVNMMRTARDSWEYWMDRFDEGKKDSFDTRGLDFDAESMREASGSSRPDITESARNENAAYQEALYWIGMFETYQEYARDSQNRLAETYGIVVFDNPSLHTAFQDGSLSEALLDESMLEDDDAWEAIYMDEFQVELLKARSYMQYWEKQEEIAQAVYDYAIDNSSTKENAEITTERLEQAKLDYDNALDEYNLLLDNLKGTGSELENCITDMETIQQEIKSYQNQLSDARSAYNIIMTDLSVDNPQYLAEQYRETYLQLLDAYGMSGSEAPGPGTALEEYLLAASEYGLEQKISLVSKQVIDLLSGGENFEFDSTIFNPETASLVELKKRYENTTDADIKAAAASAENEFTVFLSDELMLSLSDYRSDRLLDYYSLYNAPDTTNQDEILYDMLRIVEALKSEYEMQYELRLAKIKLYITEDFSQWGMQYFNNSNYGDITSVEQADPLSELKYAVEQDLSVYSRILSLYNEHDMDESFRISDFTAYNPESAMQKIWNYRRSGNIDDDATAAELHSIKTSLQKLLDWLSDFESMEDGKDELEQAVINPVPELGQDYLNAYMDGYHNLGAGDSGDMYGSIFAEELSTASMKASLLNMLSTAEGVPSLTIIHYEEARDRLISMLSDEGILDADEYSFRSPEAVWEQQAFSTQTDIAAWFLQLDMQTSELELPSSLSEILLNYISELKNYVSIRAAQTLTTEIPIDLNPLNAEIRTLSGQINNLNSLMNRLQGASDDTVKLFGIAETTESQELKKEAEKRLFETAGFDLAGQALAIDEFIDSAENWINLFDDYCSVTSTGLSAYEGYLDYRDGILDRAEELYQLALTLADYENHDWKNEIESKTISYYKAMLYNTLSFESAESYLNGASGIDPSELISLKIIDELMTGAESDFPEDPELEWIYRGNDVLRSVDMAIQHGTPVLWTEADFDLFSEVQSRYFTKSELSELTDSLIPDADETAAGLTVKDKAVELWNSEFNPGDSADIGKIMRAFTALSYIDQAMTETGLYDTEYTYSDLLAELCVDLILDDEDLRLFSAASGNQSMAVSVKLDSVADRESGTLSGEELYWNLMIKARDEALEDDYDISGIRNNLIFDGKILRAGTIAYWLNEAGRDYNVLRIAVDEAFENILQPIKYFIRSDGIYADIFAFNFASKLTAGYGYNDDEAAGLSLYFTEKLGVDTQIDNIKFTEFNSIPEEQRIYYLLNINKNAALYQLKKDIIDEKLTSEKLSFRLDEILISDVSDRLELEQLYKDLVILKTYKPLLHGDFNDYIEDECSNDTQKRRLKEIHYRYMGSPKATWDDIIFAGSFADSPEAAEILTRIETVKTRSSNTVSANSVFINEALSVYNDLLYGKDDSLIVQISTLKTERELAQRAATYLNATSSSGPDNWRSFLTAEYLKDEDGIALVPDSYVASNTSDYERDLTIGGEDKTVIQEFIDQYLFSGTGDDLENIVLDSANSCLDQAAFLTKAIESWTAEDISLTNELLTLSDTINDYSFDISYGELENLYLYKPDAGIENDYLEKRLLLYGNLSEISSLKNELSGLGHRRETLISLSGMGDAEQVMALKPLIDNITELEKYIYDAQEDWQSLIDGTDGYRQLETEYADIYEQTKSALDVLDAIKHKYSIARGIYEYATAGYLSVDDETYAIFEPDNTNNYDEDTVEYIDNTEVNSGITGGTIVAADVDIDNPTAEQLYRDALIDKINKVSPSERLTYINDKLIRATAAYDALSSIINENIDNYSTYETNEIYRALFDRYLEIFRESLVLSKINHVLNQAIARQERVTRDALKDWNKVLYESYAPVNYIDGSDSSKVNVNLEDLYIEKNTTGEYTLEWDTDRHSNIADFEAYFSPIEGSVDGHSAFENDLSLWLKNINALGNGSKAQQEFTVWAMAMKYEEYSALDPKYTDSINNEFWSVYLNKNGEEGLDRETARTMLINEWTDAHNTVESYSGDKRWMFDFYKLLEKSGSMNIGSRTDDNLQHLADEESIAIANEYMAEKYHEGANSLIIASIPLFAVATLYYVLATAALAVPFTGWIAAAILFAIAAGFTYGGTYYAVEGAMKHAAANHIKTEVVDKAKINISSFMSIFSLDTKGILESKNTYDIEYEKLLTMRGEKTDNDSNEEQSDEDRIKMLQKAAVQAFESEEEDLHGLLVQSGFVEQTATADDDETALALLFGDYQDMMSNSAKAESSNSSRFISALETVAQDYKQTTARDLNDYLTSADGIARQQAELETNYERTYYAYIKEESSLEDFNAAAEAAWQAPLFSTREHLLRLYEQQNEIAGMIMGSDLFNTDISAELLESQKVLLCGSRESKGIFGYRMDNYLENKVYEMDILRLEMTERRKHWENQMSAITARGELEWNAGERKLNREYEQWVEETRRTYNRQKETWDDKYLDFIADKDQWLDAVTIQSTKIGDMKVLENFGEMTCGAIAAAGTDIIVSELNAAVNPDDILNSVMDFELLGTLLDNAKSLTDSVDDTKTVIFTVSAPDKFITADSLQAIKDFQSLQNEEYNKHLALLEYGRLLDQVNDAEENFIETLDNANKGVEKSINKTMRDDGYIESGGLYERNLVTGATVADYIYETGYVSTYNFYRPDNTDFSSELEDAEAEIDNMDAKGLQGLVAHAMENIEKTLKKIFGDEGAEKLEIIQDEKITEEKKGPIEWLVELVTDTEEQVPGTRTVEQDPGLFGAYIGYAPEFQANADPDKEWNAEGQIKYNGRGEIGRIFGEFIFNKIREGAGWAEVNMPHYKKKLWDDTDSFVKAPSAADLTSMTISILTMGAGGAITAGGNIANALATAAVNLGDDLALSVMDIGTGERTFAEGTFDFVKTASVSMLSSLGGGFVKDLNVETLGLGEQIGIGAAQQVYNNMTSSAINALSYDSDTGWGYNLNALDQGIFGARAMAGIAGSAAGTLAGSALGDLTEDSWTEVEKASYGGALNLGSMAASQAAEYVVHAGYQLAENGFNDFGGSMNTVFDNMGMSLNIFDIGSMMDLTRLIAATASNDYSDSFMSDWNTVANNLEGTGLFALNINSSGVSGQITRGGTNISGSLYDLGKGFTMDMGIRAYEKNNDGSELLKNGYTFGDQSFEDTIWRLLAGKDSMIFDRKGSENAETINNNGSREIHMNRRYSQASDEEMLKATALLQHEAHRDGLESLFNNKETFRAVKAHTEIAIALGNAYGFDFIAGNNNLKSDVVKYMMARGNGKSNFNETLFEEYVAGAYDSTKDYWKLIENPDGSLTLHDDGRGGVFYTDENGEEHEIGHYISGSRTEHLQNVLALELTEKEKKRLNTEMLIGLGSADNYSGGHFLDDEGNQIFINLTGEWSDRMGAALDYDRMFVEAWRNDGNMDSMIEQLRFMNISEQYGAQHTDRQKYLAGKVDEAVDFSARFMAGTATEHLFSQTEIENKVGFGKNALCYGTVPVNLYQLRDPSISLDMIGDALIAANNKEFIRKDGYISEYNNYLKLLGTEFNSSQYLKQGSDFYNLQDYLKSDYTIADSAIYGLGGNEHHRLYRNNYNLIDPYQNQLSWSVINSYRYRGLEWVNF